jgi:phage gp46-like protein
MDFQLRGTNGEIGLVYAKNEDILTNILVCMNVDKGSFFQDLTFGNELYKIKKITTHSIEQAKQMVEDCLKILITSGRAASISVVVEQDSDNRSQMNIKVEATQPDGLIIVYSTFKRVV